MTARPCQHCGSTERAANGQCRCRVLAYRERRKGKPGVPATPRQRQRVSPETGFAAVRNSTAAAFLAWLPDSEIAVVSVEVRSRADLCEVKVTPAVAWSLWQRRYGR